MPVVQDFLDAARSGDVAKLRALLESDPAVLNARNEQGQSAILLAKYHRKPEAVDFLLSQGPELTLHEACAAGDLTTVRRLIAERGRLIDSHSKDGFTPLALAAFFGHREVAAFLIDQGANIDLAATNQMKVAPIHAAVSARHHTIVELLVSNQANVNARQQQGWTPLQSAAQSGDEALVRLLLAHGADPALRSDAGQNALDLALTGGHQAIVPLLEGSS